MTGQRKEEHYVTVVVAVVVVVAAAAAAVHFVGTADITVDSDGDLVGESKAGEHKHWC